MALGPGRSDAERPRDDRHRLASTEISARGVVAGRQARAISMRATRVVYRGPAAPEPAGGTVCPQTGSSIATSHRRDAPDRGRPAQERGEATAFQLEVGRADASAEDGRHGSRSRAARRDSAAFTVCPRCRAGPGIHHGERRL
jgi:hypothetical protein